MAYYNNPYGYGQQMYGSGYIPQNQIVYGGAPQPSQPSQNSGGMIWVDGEIGARAFQMPAGVTGPIALWDTNDTVVYLKSCNQAGMPNPLQKIRYQMEEQAPMLPAGQQQSGSPMNSCNTVSGHGECDYATKDDMNQLREEIMAMKELLMNQKNQNGNQNGRQGNMNPNTRGGGTNG